MGETYKYGFYINHLLLLANLQTLLNIFLYMDPLVGQCSEVSYTKLLLLNFEWTVDDFFRLNFCLSCNLCEYFTEKEANDW